MNSNKQILCFFSVLSIFYYYPQNCILTTCSNDVQRQTRLLFNQQNPTKKSQKKPISNLSKTDEPNVPCFDRSPLPKPLTSTKVNVVNCTLHSSLRGGNGGQTTAHTSFVLPSTLGLYFKVGDRYECMYRVSRLSEHECRCPTSLATWLLLLSLVIFLKDETLVV